VDVVPPPVLRAHLEQYASAAGVQNLPPFDAATLEVRFAGFHFRNHVHLVGDAAGVASSLTGEGIYAALITGEEVARQILDSRYSAPKTRAWLRTKRAHDAVARLWRSRRARDASFRALDRALRLPRARRAIVSFFVS
jgi:geranylgeranyl reductase